MDKNEEKRVFEIVWVCCFCALLVVGAVLGVLYGVNFKSEVLAPTVYEPTESPLIIEDKVENGICLTSSNAMVASDGSASQVLSAIAYNSNGDAVHSAFYWTARWNNPTSEWASTKNVEDYIELTPSEDTTSCTVVCARGFNEQILLNVCSKGNSNAQTDVAIDYVKRITSVTTSLTLNGMKYTDEATPELKVCPYDCTSHSDEHLNTIKLTVNYSSVGTVKGKFVLKKLTSLYIDESNLQSATSAIAGIDSDKYIGNEIEVVGTDKDNVFQFVYSVKDLIRDVSSAYNNTVCNFLLTNDDFKVGFGLTLDLVYNDKVVQTFDTRDKNETANTIKYATFGFNTEYLTYYVSNVTPSDTSIAF